MTNVDYLHHKLEGLSLYDNDAIRAYILGAVSGLIDETTWRNIVDHWVDHRIQSKNHQMGTARAD